MSTPTPIRSISYGGGVQSTALLVLAAQERIDFRTFLMANVGDDSEHPGTLRYLEEYARPFAAEHGIELALSRPASACHRWPLDRVHTPR
ncbi:hypothetical protein [Streptomyces microflavus]